MKDKKNIYENAIISLRLGIEDYQDKNQERHISAVRNFYSGVLLLGKFCLLDAVDDDDVWKILASYYKPQLDENKKVFLVPKGRNTIDLEEMQNRFKDFKLDWPKANIKDLQRLRNNLEHFHAVDSTNQIQQIISQCFPIIEGFFKIIGLDPAVELEETWRVMLEETNFYNAKKEECNKSFKNISLKETTSIFEITCNNCESLLLYQEDSENTDPSLMEIKCKSCSESLSAAEFIKKFVENEHGAEGYASYKDGGEQVIYSCPECSEETYVHTGIINKCYFCEYKIDDECPRCGDSLTIENMSCNNSSYCDYCDHMMSKDD